MAPATLEPLDPGIERLKDLQWELSDGERRYRDLLDAQTDLIARTDAAGRLTFVNRAWCRTFAVEAGDVLGTVPALSPLDGDAAPVEPAQPGRLRFEQLLATAAGPRWIAFERHGIGQGETQLIGRDVTEARAERTGLERARDEAEAANRAKSRFLAAMSHEIRTPMNGILGMATLLTETDLTAEQRAYTQAIDQSAKTLLTIIDEILDLSKIEAGRLEMHPVPFALDHCVQAAVELLAPKAREKGLELAWLIEPALPRLLVGDETRVRQIVLNLVGNAIKFTDRGGVAVRVRSPAAPPSSGYGMASRRTIEIEVRDTGIGIAPDQLRLLFAEFQQTEDVVARRRGGTGLGLAISRQLARAMHGDIAVESAVGEGSVFRARLELESVEDCGTLLPAADKPGPVGEGRTRALLAIDRPIERAILEECLASLGIEAVSLTSAAETLAPALAELRAGAFAVVIADALIGPDCLGQLLAAARRSARAAGRAGVRALVLIEPSERAGLERLRTVGFDGYLVRPIRPMSLARQLDATAAPNLAIAATAARAARLPVPASPPANARAIGPRTILLVEDNDINALLARRMGERARCNVIHARSGTEALAAAEWLMTESAGPDLVLMDIHMPEMDGFEVARRLRSFWSAAGRRAPPIAALTANAFPEDRRRCLDEGLDDFLAKPFERDELEALLDRWCPDGAGREGFAA